MIGNQLLDVGLHWPVDGQSIATSTVLVHVYTILDSSCAGTLVLSQLSKPVGSLMLSSEI